MSKAHIRQEVLVSLRDVRPSIGARQKSIEPHDQTLATERAYRQVVTSTAERAAALAQCIEHYDTRRRHPTPPQRARGAGRDI